MNKPNETFHLTVKELELAETGLRTLPQSNEVRNLLGKIHNQKVWYHPKDEVYVSG